MNTYDIKKHLIGVGIRPSCAGLNYLSEEIMEAMEASKKILFYNLHQEVAKNDAWRGRTWRETCNAAGHGREPELLR